jgi:hypothetical protein
MTKQRTSRKNGRKGRNGKKSHSGGDAPPAARRTVTTISCPLPRVTETCVIRATQVLSIAATPTTNYYNSYNFTLASTTVTSGFWDQYRIDAIRFSIVPQNNAIGLVTNSTTSLTPLYCVIDYDDNTNLGSINAALAYSNCITLNPGESCERLFKPRMAVSAYASSFGSFANMGNMWIDSASTSVQHYGIKVVVPGVAAAQTLLQSWDVIVEYYFTFRKAI